MLLDFLIIYLLKKPSIFDPYGEIKCPPEYHLEPSTKKGTPFLRFPVSCCQAYIKANELSASKVPNAVTMTLVLSNVAIWLISRVLIILIRIPTCRAIAMTVVTL